MLETRKSPVRLTKPIVFFSTNTLLSVICFNTLDTRTLPIHINIILIVKGARNAWNSPYTFFHTHLGQQYSLINVMNFENVYYGLVYGEFWKVRYMLDTADTLLFINIFEASNIHWYNWDKEIADTNWYMGILKKAWYAWYSWCAF